MSVPIKGSPPDGSCAAVSMGLPLEGGPAGLGFCFHFSDCASSTSLRSGQIRATTQRATSDALLGW